MNKNIIYLDNAATTPVHPEVLQEMIPYFTEYYGNPSGIYSLSQRPKEALANARKNISSFIGAKENEIYFTGSGTESDNWAVISTAEKFSAK